MTIFPGPPRHAPRLRGDKAGAHPASHPSRTAAARWRRFGAKAALLGFMVAAAPLSAVRAQTAPTVSVFAPASATATAQARAASAAAATASCPSGFVCVPFGAFTYPIDPNCLDQHVIKEQRIALDPNTGENVAYNQNIVFIKAGDDGYIVIPQPETKATGPDAGRGVGALLCAGKAGSQ